MKYFVIILLVIGVFVILQSPAYGHHNDRESRGSDDPKITSHGDTAYVVWDESTDPQYWDVYFRKIIDGNAHEPINLTKGTSFNPKISVATSGDNVYVLWEDRQSPKGDDAIYFAKSSDSGQTFDAPKMIAPTHDDTTVYRVLGMQNSKDVLYVFASNWNRDTQQHIAVYFTSTDFGETFSEPILLFEHEQFDQEIEIKKSGQTIYMLSDDRSDYDEIGSLYMRQILSDGTLTEIANVNGGKTSVTHAQFAVHGDDIYVSWRERVFEKDSYGATERWYPAFTKSHDGGITFDEPILLETDPKSVDTVGAPGGFVFANDDYVSVLWRSEYWDGKDQEFKIHVASSDNKGNDFDVRPHHLNDSLDQYGSILTFSNGDYVYSMALTAKNFPQNDAAVYFASKNWGEEFSKPFDVLDGISTEIDMPELAADDGYVHFVASGRSNENCLLYSYSSDNGESFSDITDISPHGNDYDCLGILPEVPTPLQQLNSGIAIQDIQCGYDITKGSILVLKASDQMPACITADSYLQLKDRGWISDDYGKILALRTARDFVESSPTFSFDGIADSLQLDVLHTRESIPAVVTAAGKFQSAHDGYGNRLGQKFSDEEHTATHDIEMTIAGNNMIHSAVLDETWNMMTQDTGKQSPSTHRGTASSPTVGTTLTVKEPVTSRGLVPVIITEKSENVSNSVTFWQFQIIGYHGDNRYETWDKLPDDKRIGWLFQSEDGNTDVWDDSVIPGNRFGIPADLHGYTMFCDGKRVDGESGHPSTIPIKPEFETIYVSSGDKAILPDPDGVYSLEFATLFETKVELPDSAKVIENKTILCTMEESREDATHGYYTKLAFQTDNNNLGSVHTIPSPNSIEASSKPYDGAVIGDDHSHASVLVKIFGDKFDFSHAEFQIKSPWIHFEAQDGSTIHRHAKHVTLGYLFDTLNILLSSDCFVFPEGRDFCNNDEYALKFYINGEKADGIRDYVIADGDRILVSYGF